MWKDRLTALEREVVLLAAHTKQKLLLTGASGFVGGLVRQVTPSYALSLDGIDVDIRSAQAVEQAVAQIRPDAVLHLAAQTFVPRSFDDPVETFDTNFLGTYNLLAGLQKIDFRGRFLLVSTGDVYGSVAPELLPVSEAALPRPRNPYAVSKVAAEALCFQWNATAAFETIVARPFNHIGPGQREDFVISGFAKQIAEIKHGARPAVIYVGDIDVTRDFCDVRDVVQAYLLLLQRGRAGEIYNVCSGQERSIRSLLQKMLEIAGTGAEIRTDFTRIRTSEQKRVCGDASKIRQDTGWRPEYAIEKTLEETIQSWEYQIA